MRDAHPRPSFGRPVCRAATLLALLVAATPTLAAGGLVPQHAEALTPSLERASSTGETTLEFAAFERVFRVTLSRNDRLEKVAAGGTVQLYKGALEGVPGSWARITLHDGLPRGMIWDGRELFIVDAEAEGVNRGAAGTRVFKLSDAVLEEGVSFAGDAVEAPDDPAAAYDAMIGELRHRAQALEARVATEGVEISVLGDADYLARYPNETQARDALLTRLNNVDGIFSAQIGVALQVVSVDIGGEVTSSLPPGTEAGALLEELGQIRQRTPALSATGLTHLFTGRSLDGNQAGIAYTLALCNRRFAASITRAHSSAVLDSLITAHEIGHVFGAPHDGTQQCAATPQNEFIMTPTLNTSVNSFSQCSVDEIDAVIDSYACVVALPQPAPTPTPTPTPPPAPPPGGEGGGGGGGAVDPLWLLLLSSLLFGSRARRNLPR